MTAPFTGTGRGSAGLPRAGVAMLGRRFGSLIVLKRAGVVGDKRGAFWLCKCDCGARYVALGYRLRAGRVVSCGRGVHTQQDLEAS